MPNPARSSAWRHAYDYPHWRSQEERTAFADYHEGRARSCERHVILGSYGEWLFARVESQWGDVDIMASKQVDE